MLPGIAIRLADHILMELLRTVLGPVWTGEQTAEQAITENYDALNAVFMGE